jgi:hypothetical protein
VEKLLSRLQKLAKHASELTFIRFRVKTTEQRDGTGFVYMLDNGGKEFVGYAVNSTWCCANRTHRAEYLAELLGDVVYGGMNAPFLEPISVDPIIGRRPFHDG